MRNESKIGAGVDNAPSALVVVGLAVFTFVVVTARFGLADVGIIVALAGLLMRPQELRFPAPFWWGMALVVWALLTASFAISPQIALDTAIERLKVFVVFLVVINTLRTGWYLRLYVLFILACFMLFPARGALMNYFSGYRLFGRALWNQIYANPNDLAAMSLLALGLSLSVLASKGERKLIRWSTAASAVTLVVIIFLTQSRGAFIGMTLGMGPGTIGLIWRRPRAIVGLLILLSTGVALMPDAVWTRLSGISKLTSTDTIAQADPEGSAAQRWEIQKTAFRIFQDHPLAGVGLGCYPLANRLYEPHLGPRDTHNTYLNLAAELGLPGLLIWLALIASVLRRCRRALRAKCGASSRFRVIWIKSAIIGFLVASLFGGYSGSTMLYLMLGILWSAASLAQNARVTEEVVRAEPLREY